MDLFDIAVAKKLAGGGGGGNPNFKQVIVGTMADPFGTVDIGELSKKTETMNASVLFEADVSVLSPNTTIRQYLSGIETNFKQLYANGASFGPNGQGPVDAFILVWGEGEDRGLVVAKMFTGGNIVDVLAYATMIPTTVTIIWHPLS